MFKKILTFAIFFFFFFLIPPGFYLLQSQPIILNQEKIEYNLPYPGILPDHPLFILKNLRDKMLELATRDSLKKAELYLQFADKRAAMALSLAKNGKEKMSATAYSEAEDYFAKITDLLNTSQEQGVTASSEFVQRLRLSNSKHKEVGASLLRDLSQGFSGGINKSLDLNKQIKIKLEKL